jgi:hypothetical protein
LLSVITKRDVARVFRIEIDGHRLRGDRAQNDARRVSANPDESALDIRRLHVERRADHRRAIRSEADRPFARLIGDQRAGAQQKDKE